jgi:hypothetical protein
MQTTKNFGNDAGIKEIPYTVGRNVSEYNHFEKKYGGSSKY